MIYAVVLTKSAASVLRRADRTLQRRILQRLEQLCVDPQTPPLSDWVEGTADLRKSRVGGWRILFRIASKSREVIVVAIRPRGQAYRDL